MKSFLSLTSMLFKENFVGGEFDRKPEDDLVMDGAEQVIAWHREGADEGPIAAVYHLQAQACSNLAPAGSTVIDLGCGTGRFAAYLARHRPDLRIIGIDLSESMLATGREALQALGIADRVELRRGDMTSFADDFPESDIGLINCLFALHHLPTIGLVEQCLKQIHSLSGKEGCSFILFDLVRPRHMSTAYQYPQALTPTASRAFQLDSEQSLIAAYSRTELQEAVSSVFGTETVSATQSRILPLYQCYWHRAESDAQAESQNAVDPRGRFLTPDSRPSGYGALRTIFPDFPV